MIYELIFFTLLGIEALTSINPKGKHNLFHQIFFGYNNLYKDYPERRIHYLHISHIHYYHEDQILVDELSHIRIEVGADMLKIRQWADESRPYPDGLLTNRVISGWVQ